MIEEKSLWILFEELSGTSWSNGKDGRLRVRTLPKGTTACVSGYPHEYESLLSVHFENPMREPTHGLHSPRN